MKWQFENLSGFYYLFLLFFAIVYIALVYYSFRDDEFSKRDIKFKLYPLDPAPTVLASSVFLISGVLIAIAAFSHLFLDWNQIVSDGLESKWSFATAFVASAFLLTTGTAIMLHWKHMAGMMLIATAFTVISTLTHQSMFDAEKPFLFLDLVTIGVSIFLIIGLGMSYSAKFFSLVKGRAPRRIRPKMGKIISKDSR